MVEKFTKNLIPLAIIIAGLLITGAIVFVNRGKIRGKIEEAGPPTITQPESLPTSPEESSLEVFAKCLTEKEAKFYGAFWCGWCDRQKQLFGEAAQYLPYIECSDLETRQLTPECQKEGITGFPTWEFNGTKISGFKTLEELAKLSGCSL